MSVNLTDLNVQAEYFYRDFLNLVLGYQLKNINSITQNADAIDLADIDAKVAIQVTSTSAIKKTRETVKKFIDKKLYEHYDTLIILNLVEITKHQEPEIGVKNVFTLKTATDIWDHKSLIRKISDKDTPELKRIVDFLNVEL